MNKRIKKLSLVGRGCFSTPQKGPKTFCFFFQKEGFPSPETDTVHKYHLRNEQAVMTAHFIRSGKVRAVLGRDVKAFGEKWLMRVEVR